MKLCILIPFDPCKIYKEQSSFVYRNGLVLSAADRRLMTVLSIQCRAWRLRGLRETPSSTPAWVPEHPAQFQFKGDDSDRLFPRLGRGVGVGNPRRRQTANYFALILPKAA